MIQDTNRKLKIAGIYTIIHTASKRAYVGQTNNWHYRKYQHKRGLVTNTHGNDRLQKAWNKHSEKAFEFKLQVQIKGLSGKQLKRKLNRLEVKIAKRFPLLYNLHIPGKERLVASKLTRLRLSRSISKSNNTPAFRKKLSASIKEAWKRPEYRSALTTAAKKERNTSIGRARMRRIITEAFTKASFRRKHKKAIQAAWKNPKIKAARIAAFNTPEAKINRSNSAKQGWLKRKSKL